MTQVSLVDYATAAHLQDAKARWLMPGLVRMRGHAGFLQTKSPLSGAFECLVAKGGPTRDPNQSNRTEKGELPNAS